MPRIEACQDRSVRIRDALVEGTKQVSALVPVANLSLAENAVTVELLRRARSYRPIESLICVGRHGPPGLLPIYWVERKQNESLSSVQHLFRMRRQSIL